ncbi:hypothetical protein PV08_02814 [Exophiala spinifera]|uniref:Uncharacterized protein n=1 Tax=Exophiala spinifera TaxID=91928 RepID=A0A0D1YTI6_9EURO|nr:uncharacterized protein PV08_02814 [Exophiala spinifera]KIW18526.1 hypothetical protein PV08_02814 [Exophiala spinifera]
MTATQTQILLITGGNTGLGYETVRSLCQSPTAYAILLAGRDLAKAEAAVKQVQKEISNSSSTVTPIQVDVDDDDSINKAFERVSADYGRLDVLINNAGVQLDPLLLTGKMTMREAWNKSWSVNTTGAQIMTYTFVPLLLKSSNPRLLFITSGTSTLTEAEKGLLWIDQVPPKGWPKEPMGIGLGSYRSSKTGLNMMMREWSRILKEDGVKVFAISPGLLVTGLGGNPELIKKMGGLDPAIGANVVRDVVEGKRDQDAGKVLRRDSIQPW